MRVLLVAASPRFIGGQSVMAQRLVEDLRRDGVAVEFLPVDPLLPRPLRPLDRVKFLRTILRSIVYLLSLLRRVPRSDVIHVFSASYASFLISPAPALVVGRLFRKKTILNYRSGEASDHLRRSGWLTKKFIGLATCLAVPSGYLVDVFQQFGYSAVAIPNHVDLSSFEYRERSRIRPRILVARMLEPLYNISCALRAFRLVQDKHPQAELVILGEGSQRRYLERLALELQLSGVAFAGRIDRDKIANFYEQADIFLNTSSIDNMPVSILEAFAAGLPVVTTAAGGIPYLIQDRVNGHLVPVGDFEAIAQRILEVIENGDERRRLSRVGRQEMEKYRWSTIGPQWRDLYRNVAADHKDLPSRELQALIATKDA